MSDFVRVNFERGVCKVIHKSAIEIQVCEGRFILNTPVSILENILGSNYRNGWDDHMDHQRDFCGYITREEYERLCMILGVGDE